MENMYEIPSLIEFIDAQTRLRAENRSFDYLQWRQIFVEHLVNRHRAVAKDLTPLRIYEYEVRLQHHLETEKMTGSEYEHTYQLRDALVEGDEHWQQLVLAHLGLNLDPEKGITNFRRSVLVYVFRHGRPPLKEPWYNPDKNVVLQLAEEGYIDMTRKPLRLTEEGLAAAGVLWPRVRYNSDDTFYVIDPDNYGALVGPMREHRQAIVKLLEVTHS